MTEINLRELPKQEIKDYITGLWSKLWDGTAGNAYVSVEVLGATLDEVKEALVLLITEFKDKEVVDMLEKDNLWLHENSLADDGCISMAYWKGNIDFAYALSKVLPNALVVCNDGGWYGIDECIIAKNGSDAVPGVDYIGDMEYCSNADDSDDEESDEDVYCEVSLQIIAHNGKFTFVGGGMISEDDTEKYKLWASSVTEVEEINWDRNAVNTTEE